MKHSLIFLMVIAILVLSSCTGEKKQENPFLSEFTTPFQVPPFDKIDSTHFLPAFEEGMRLQNAEIQAIIENSEAPTFDNTVLPFDKSGKVLTRVSKVFNNLTEANTSEQLQELAKTITPMVSKHADEIMMNEKLFARIKSVYEQRQTSNLDAQQIRCVEKYYRDFVRRGADLPKEKQEKLKKVNEELSMLELAFGDNLLAETNKNFKLVIEDKKDLEGLPEEAVLGAAETAKSMGMEGKWVFTLAKPSWIPFLQYAKNRELREKIYRAWFMRGNNGNANDNKETIAKIVKLRFEKSQLLGYPDFAAYVIDDNMAKTPENVDLFLKKLWDAALPVSKNELADMQKIIDREGGNFKLQSWDWWYYAEKIRKEKYDLDEAELKPYFSLQNVLDGMFHVAKNLFGITFTKVTNLPVYHPDVETYEVREADRKHLGILYLDFYPRESKRGGAWCTDFQSAGWDNGKKVDPVVTIVTNVSKPTGDQPALLTFEDVTTLFHEFGHGLHSLFAEGKYNRTAGVVPMDYVELPSQIMENWASEPEVLRAYAKHFKTGEVIPDKLVEKIEKSGLFNQGFATVEYLAASILDMNYHEVKDTLPVDVPVFEQAAMDKIGLISEIIPRYRSTYFAHIFSGEYAAGYYVYIWAAVLDADAFNAFKSSGNIYNPELAAKFRKYCLQDCGEDEGMVQYRKFRGQDPDIDPLLKRRGLK